MEQGTTGQGMARKSICEAKCAASLEEGLLTLEDGTTIDLGKIEKLLSGIADAAMPASNDGEHDLLVDCLNAGQMARDELAAWDKE